MSPDNIAHWSEFGLAGLVIAVLFAALFVVVKWLIGHIDKQAERHHQERAEWRESSGDVAEKIEKAVAEVSNGIKTLIDRGNQK